MNVLAAPTNTSDRTATVKSFVHVPEAFTRRWYSIKITRSELVSFATSFVDFSSDKFTFLAFSFCHSVVIYVYYYESHVYLGILFCRPFGLILVLVHRWLHL